MRKPVSSFGGSVAIAAGVAPDESLQSTPIAFSLEHSRGIDKMLHT
jgi:hypothetical protein